MISGKDASAVNTVARELIMVGSQAHYSGLAGQHNYQGASTYSPICSSHGHFRDRFHTTKMKF